ncbi:MAG TPA: hypothetical protein PKL04_00785 [Methanofastidiosum sp.]|nr:hypothetical protein [Methanofastidiosum sp.]
MKPTETLKELTIAFIFIFLASLACHWAIVVVDERKQKTISTSTTNNKIFVLTEKEYEIYLKAKAESEYEK